MRLNHLRIKNICQHSEFELDLSPGLVGVLGPNGSGKTNLTGTALCFALTGDAPDWARADLLRQGADKGSAEVCFDTADGREAVLRWSVPGNGQSLSVDGGSPLSKAGDIRAELAHLYGMDPALVHRACFMPQRGFSDFAYMLPTRRADSLKALFADIDSDRAMADIQAEINQVGAAVDYAPAVASAELALSEAASAEEAADLRLASAREVLASMRQGYEAALGRLQLPVLGEDPSRLEDAARSAVDAAASALARHEAARPAVPEPPPAPRADGGEMKKTAARYVSEHARHAALVERVYDIDAETAENAASDLSQLELDHLAENAELAACADREQRAREARDEAEKTLKFAEGGAPCPVSGSRCPVLPGPEKVAELKAARSDAYSEWQSRKTALDQQAAKAAKASKALNDARSAEARKDGMRRRLAGEKAQVESDISAAEAWLSSAYDAVRGFDEAGYDAAVAALAAHGRAEAAAAAHDRRSLELSRALSAARAALEDACRPREAITQAERAAAQAAVDGYAAAERAVAQAGREQSDARSLRSAKAASLDAVRMAAATSAVNARVRDGLESFRLFIHRGNGPGYVVRSNLSRYNAAMARHLDELGFGLRAWVDESFELKFDKPAMKIRSMSGARLSGAEAVAVSLADRLARRDVTACRVPLLVLDEPAAAMSRDKVEELARLFARLRDRVRGQVTVLVPSHAAALEPSFERIVRL